MNLILIVIIIMEEEPEEVWRVDLVHSLLTTKQK